MGMLATVMNGLALQDAMRTARPSSPACRSALVIEQVVEPYIRGRAIRALEQGRTVIFAGGTATLSSRPTPRRHCAAPRSGAGNRAQGDEGRRHLLGRPRRKDPLATKYDKISFNEAISKNLAVMDTTAFALCRDQKLPINVFSIFKTGALKRVVLGEREGTLVYC